MKEDWEDNYKTYKHQKDTKSPNNDTSDFHSSKIVIPVLEDIITPDLMISLPPETRTGTAH